MIIQLSSLDLLCIVALVATYTYYFCKYINKGGNK